MDETKTIPENETVDVPVVEAENTNVESQPIEEKPKKRKFWQSPKFIFGVIMLFAIIALVLWLNNVFAVYNQATKFQKSHDIAVKELDFCDKIEGTSQPKEVFDYCDQLKERFKNVER